MPRKKSKSQQSAAGSGSRGGRDGPPGGGSVAYCAGPRPDVVEGFYVEPPLERAERIPHEAWRDHLRSSVEPSHDGFGKARATVLTQRVADMELADMGQRVDRMVATAVAMQRDKHKRFYDDEKRFFDDKKRFIDDKKRFIDDQKRFQDAVQRDIHGLEDEMRAFEDFMKNGLGWTAASVELLLDIHEAPEIERYMISR